MLQWLQYQYPAEHLTWLSTLHTQPNEATVKMLLLLTPSLPQPVKFIRWKVHGRACKQYISGPITLLVLMLYILMKILSHTSVKMKMKRLKGFQFCTFNSYF